MYQPRKRFEKTVTVNKSYEGERIEEKIDRIVNNKEPIKDGAPIIYTERKDGVQPQYDIRTDRWEIAADAMDKVTASHRAKREERHKKPETKQGTDETGTAAADGMKKEGEA